MTYIPKKHESFKIKLSPVLWMQLVLLFIFDRESYNIIIKRKKYIESIENDTVNAKEPTPVKSGVAKKVVNKQKANIPYPEFRRNQEALKNEIRSIVHDYLYLKESECALQFLESDDIKRYADFAIADGIRFNKEFICTKISFEHLKSASHDDLVKLSQKYVEYYIHEYEDNIICKPKYIIDKDDERWLDVSLSIEAFAGVVKVYVGLYINRNGESNKISSDRIKLLMNQSTDKELYKVD